MTTTMNSIVVGGGQAGLSVSYYLTQHAVERVLERADKPGDAWRNYRWDSFTLNTPRWQLRFPGVRYGEDDPGGFMPKRKVVAHLDNLARLLLGRVDLPPAKPPRGDKVNRVQCGRSRSRYLLHSKGHSACRASPLEGAAS
jgi:putative flavoprotein involved in K+ transport